MNINKAISAVFFLSGLLVSTGCVPLAYVPPDTPVVYVVPVDATQQVPPGTPVIFMPTPLYYVAPAPVFYWSWNSRCCRARRHHCR